MRCTSFVCMRAVGRSPRIAIDSRDALSRRARAGIERLEVHAPPLESPPLRELKRYTELAKAQLNAVAHRVPWRTTLLDIDEIREKGKKRKRDIL